MKLYLYIALFFFGGSLVLISIIASKAIEYVEHNGLKVVINSVWNGDK